MKKLIYILFLVVFAVTANAQTELVSSGSGSAYDITYPAAFSYSTGITITFRAHATCNASPTLNINALGVKTIKKNVSTNLAFGDILLNQYVTVIYDGTNFQLTSPVSGASTAWSLGGNAVGVATNFGTTTAYDLPFITGNVERMRIFSTGEVAIGNPPIATGAGFSVSGTGLWSSAISINNTSGGQDWRIASDNDSYLKFIKTSGATFTAMVMSGTTGNIGIGTSNPTEKLHLYSTINNGSDIMSETDAGRVVKHWFKNAGGSWSIGQTGSTIIPQYNFVITDETAGLTRLAITTTGNVGIGTIDPNALLNINHASNSQIRLTTGALGNNTTDGLLFDLNNTAGSINLYENLPLYFATNGTNKMMISASGDIAVNTSSPGKVAGVSKYFTIAQNDLYNSENVSLELQGSTAIGINGTVSRIDFINRTVGSNHLARIEARTGNALTNGNLVFSTHDGAVINERMKIMNDGKVGIGLASATNPATMLDVNGDFALRQTLAPDAITFNPLDATARSLMNMNALSANFQIRTIRGTGDGKLMTIINPTTYTMSLRDQSSGFGIATERIITGTGATVNYPGPCVVTLVYNSTSSRWVISSVASPASNADALWTKTGTVTYLTNSADAVGIGTSSPATNSKLNVVGGGISIGPYQHAALHVEGNIGGFGRMTQINPTGASANALNLMASTDAGSAQQWWTWGVNQNIWSINPGTNFSSTTGLFVTSAGNVGIGTNSPGASRLNILIPSTDATNPYGMIINNNYTGASDKYGIDVNVDGAGSGQKYGISSSVVGLAGDASVNYGYQVAMTPNGTGTVYGLYSTISGVGTGNRYGIYNSVSTGGVFANVLYGQYDYVSSSGGATGTVYGHYLNMPGTTTATEYGLYVTGEEFNYFSGGLRLGNNVSTEKFTAEHSVSGLYTARFNNLANTTTAHGIIIRAGDNTTGGSTFVRFYRGDGASIGQIQQNSATSVQYLTTSDRNLKNLYGETKHGLNDLMKIKIYDYSYKDDVNKTKMTGFVAQELYEAFPQSVVAPNGNKDDNGNDLPWMVDYGSISPLLVKSIQDQQKLIEDLQKQINDLKSQLNK